MTDTLQNNLITVAPDGTISETLTGKLDAAGVVFPEFTSTPSADTSQIQWTRADGTVVADIEGGEDVPTTGAQTQLFLVAESPDLVGAPISGIELAANLLPTTAQFVRAFANGIEADVLVGDGSSDFLRLLSRQRLQLAFGFASFVFAGGTNQSNALVVNHNIGRTPQLILGLPNGAFTAGQAPSLSNSAFTINTATFVLTLPVGVNPAAGGFGNLWWAAAG